MSNIERPSTDPVTGQITPWVLPPLSKILEGVERDLLIHQLEQRYSESLRCDHTHKPDSISPTCSGEVIARFTTCTLNWNICQAAKDGYRFPMSLPIAHCEDCDRRCSECWKIREL